MANSRNEIEIPAGVWTKIIDGKTAGRVFEKKVLNKGYITLEYNDTGDNPNTLTIPITPNSETVEEMVFENKEWIHQSSVNGYVWVAPVGSEDGLLVITT
jgi:hypothetical protein